MTNTGRATAEIPSSSTSSRYSGAFSNRPMKVIKILIDNNYTFTINVPEKITLPIIEETYGNQRNS